MTTTTQITERCAVCREDAKAAVDFDSKSRTVECARCGFYRITAGAMALLDRDTYTELQRARLSAVSRRATERKGFTDILKDLLPALIDSVTAPTDPMEAADDVLLHISAHTHSFGALVPFDISTLYPLFVLPNKESLNNVVQYMLSERWIALSTGTAAALFILPNGYTRLRELRQTKKASSRAFVAMSFNPQFRSIYDDAIKPAIISVGFEPVRVDDVPHNDRIDERIIAEIRRSAFLVADFSDPRPGVYFEAGYAMGLGLPVIWTRALVEGQPSRTAMVVVLMRAAHTRSGRPSLIEDPWSDRLVPEAMHAFEAERILTAAGFLGRWRLRLLLRSRQAIVDFGGHETLNPHPVRHVNRKSVNRSTNQARCRGR